MYGIFTYIWLTCIVNVGKYTSLMDPMGNGDLSETKKITSNNSKITGEV